MLCWNDLADTSFVLLRHVSLLLFASFSFLMLFTLFVNLRDGNIFETTNTNLDDQKSLLSNITICYRVCTEPRKGHFLSLSYLVRTSY